MFRFASGAQIANPPGAGFPLPTTLRKGALDTTATASSPPNTKRLVGQQVLWVPEVESFFACRLPTTRYHAGFQATQRPPAMRLIGIREKSVKYWPGG